MFTYLRFKFSNIQHVKKPKLSTVLFASVSLLDSLFNVVVVLCLFACLFFFVCFSFVVLFSLLVENA